MNKFPLSRGSSDEIIRKLLGRIKERCGEIPYLENAALRENLSSILWYHVNIRIGDKKFDHEKNEKDLQFEDLEKNGLQGKPDTKFECNASDMEF